jgi:DNA-binding NtrC family response regulator
MTKKRGYAVRTATHGKEALNMLDGVGVVLSDFNMPGINGIELLNTVRDRCPGVIRYLLTGSLDFPSVHKAVAKGVACAAFAKPWDEGLLLFAIRRGLEQSAERWTIQPTAQEGLALSTAPFV